MHEMALAESVREIVEDAAARQGCSRVCRVILEIGELASVEVDALLFCLEVVLRESVAAGAAIDVESKPGLGWCMACADTVPIARRFDACPRCGSYQVEPVSGTELRVRELEIGEIG